MFTEDALEKPRMLPQNSMIKSVTRVPLDWHQGLSIYASGPFLEAVSDEFGWIGGIDECCRTRCILPYTIIRKPFLRMVRFRVATIPTTGELSVDEERQFLELVVRHLQSSGADIIIPATANTLFRTYPSGADAAPYGSYIVDLTQSEEILWSKLHSKHRNVIRNAIKKEVKISEGICYLNVAHELIRNTLQRSGMGFMSHNSFERFVRGLGENVKILVADSGGAIQACAVILFSQYGAYYIYGGGISNPVTGAMNLLQWEAMQRFKILGVKQYDFVGARISPEKGSKQEGLSMFKERFGGEFEQGYMWKQGLHRLKYAIYSFAAKLRSGGDIVDKERHKLRLVEPTISRSSNCYR